jgi:AcrR family transcriptional regulator
MSCPVQLKRAYMNEADLRQRIIEAGRDRFFAMGFSKVTMDELVGELGISKKTMYKHFPSKDELVDAIVDWQMIHVAHRVKEIMNSPVGFVERIHHLWLFIGEMFSRISQQYRDDVRRFRPDLWKRIEDFRREHLIENAAKFVDEGRRLGIFRQDVNKEILVLMYVSAVQAVLNPEVLAQHSFSAQEAFEAILHVMFDGTLTDEGRIEYRRRFCPQDNPA